MSDFEGNNESIIEVLDQWFDSKMELVHTCIPGRIEEYSSKERRASVKPLVKTVLVSGDVVEIPPIVNVPVQFLSSKNFSMTFPLEKGDGVTILFSETGIGNFLSGKGQDVEADDQSRFSLTDAIAIPGLIPFSSVPDAPDGVDLDKDVAINLGEKKIVIKGDSDTITIKTESNGEVTIDENLLDMKNQVATLKNKIDELWDAIIQTRTDTATWMAPLAAAPAAPVLGGVFIGPLATEQAAVITDTTTKSQVGNLLKD
jgi:hypothetical protein